MIRMRDFSWSYFWATGDVESYMLYKQIIGDGQENDDVQDEPAPAEEMADGG
jgi:hypothetical protein